MAITANAETLMRQASMTATEYMIEAVKEIDNLFGDGFAKKNPRLVGDFMKVASKDFQTSITCKTTYECKGMCND
jgi:hypothetical protein